MTKITFHASKWKHQEDHEGEVTLIFKVPQSDAKQTLDIPVNTDLVVTIEPQEA